MNRDQRIDGVATEVYGRWVFDWGSDTSTKHGVYTVTSGAWTRHESKPSDRRKGMTMSGVRNKVESVDLTHVPTPELQRMGERIVEELDRRGQPFVAPVPGPSKAETWED